MLTLVMFTATLTRQLSNLVKAKVPAVRVLSAQSAGLTPDTRWCKITQAFQTSAPSALYLWTTLISDYRLRLPLVNRAVLPGLACEDAHQYLNWRHACAQKRQLTLRIRLFVGRRNTSSQLNRSCSYVNALGYIMEEMSKDEALQTGEVSGRKSDIAEEYMTDGEICKDPASRL
ncbi:hypothetical protein P389DRAFT_71521 [Cystobasidium minutum MCA 4210]|uniref:uncharacterized protein n=1 Tax=Cystobasidium minutum MCA 4210 TaxID=1397322 RepID=UPI0034CDF66F|eukprot:jgi/Rhomi1/71521/CE71520_118